jgi:hypothetical protein
MRITNELKTRRIEFIILESVKEHYPTHKIKIVVETENIQTNFNNYIWLSEADMEQFLVELEALDKNRTGQAILESMSPGELKLTFRAIDSLGHLSAALQYKKEDVIDKDYSYELMVEFQIDPTALPYLRIQILEMIK